MVKSFRVSDLQTLLASMGRSKSGLKQDLVGRALRLVQTEYSPELLKNIRQLYESRFPKASGWLAARRPEGGVPVAYSSLSSSPTASPQGADYLNGGLAKASPTPVPEVKLVSLPFYQTMETLLRPTELGKDLHTHTHTHTHACTHTHTQSLSGVRNGCVAVLMLLLLCENFQYIFFVDLYTVTKYLPYISLCGWAAYISWLSALWSSGHVTLLCFSPLLSSCPEQREAAGQPVCL